MPYVTSPDGVHLSYEIAGSGPWLLLHLGAGCDADLWRAAGYVDELAMSYRCILFDHRGHGASGRPQGAESHRLPLYVDDVLAVLDELHVASCAFWGYSRGIDTGLLLAAKHRARVWALVGSGTVAGGMSAERAAELAAEFGQHGWEKLLERFDAEETDPIPIWMKERIRATDVDQFVDFCKAIAIGGWDAQAELPHVQAPTLFLTGEREDPQDMMARLVARMPNGRRVRLRDLGHVNAFLRSDLVLSAVRLCLDENAPSYGASL
jgi:pimeloyl-ACP methyl ester carboxylesterase